MKKIIKFAIYTSILVLVLGFANQVNAQPATLDFPAGLACDFPLRVVITPSNHYVIKEWSDEYGNPVRMLTAGRGADLEFINMDTEATFFVKGNGSVSHTTFNSDGSSIVSATGHNVLILFPSDNPPGPSTKQYVGRVVYTINTDGTWTFQKVSGRTTDICAALSQ